MQENKRDSIMGMIESSTKIEIMGTSRFNENHVLFLEILPAIKNLRDKYPKAGAPKISARITKIMAQNGYPKFKLTTANLSKWFEEATGERFCLDPKAVERGAKLKKARAAKAALVPDPRPIHPEEPEPETPAVMADQPIGLEEVAGMTDDDLAILEGDDTAEDDLAAPPDPFGDV